MPLDATQQLHEATSSDDANAHLKLGWTLVNQYVTDYFGGQNPHGRHETIHFVLAWQGDGKPKRPASRFGPAESEQ